MSAVVHLMEVMLDPVSRALAHAPLEDEEISQHEEHAVATGIEPPEFRLRLGDYRLRCYGAM